MKVTNPHSLPYSLLTASGKYEVIDPETTRDDLKVHPAVIDEYREKGFQIEVEDESELTSQDGAGDEGDGSDEDTTDEGSEGAQPRSSRRNRR